ncbi:MAG: hypothetical protein GX051_10225 [Clostridiales bacterium]|nr:hypothetical protein [Clostridiales bacterium]
MKKFLIITLVLVLAAGSIIFVFTQRPSESDLESLNYVYDCCAACCYGSFEEVSDYAEEAAPVFEAVLQNNLFEYWDKSKFYKLEKTYEEERAFANSDADKTQRQTVFFTDVVVTYFKLLLSSGEYEKYQQAFLAYYPKIYPEQAYAQRFIHCLRDSGAMPDAAFYEIEKGFEALCELCPETEDKFICLMSLDAMYRLLREGSEVPDSITQRRNAAMKGVERGFSVFTWNGFDVKAAGVEHHTVLNG